MIQKIKFNFLIAFILILTTANSQSSEIVKLDEKNVYQYISYYEDGSKKSIIGFYAKEPYSSVELFEAKLKKYDVKYHKERKEFYRNGQLKEIVNYNKGKVIEFAKHYFEDGEEFAVSTDLMPEFQFDIHQQNIWFNKKIQEIESKYQINLEGKAIIALEIGRDGTIKFIKVKAPDKTQEIYLLEIGNQIEVKKPAKKNGQDIGTKFAFKIDL